MVVALLHWVLCSARAGAAAIKTLLKDRVVGMKEWRVNEGVRDSERGLWKEYEESDQYDIIHHRT